MTANPAEELGKRLLACLDMWEFGVELTELRFCREHPEASDPEISAMIQAWLRERPADGAGRVLPWPRP